jgi:hypothetical protein
MEGKRVRGLLRLDEIAREGARRMLLEALKVEVDDYVERHRSKRDERGHALVVQPRAERDTGYGGHQARHGDRIRIRRAPIKRVCTPPWQI